MLNVKYVSGQQQIKARDIKRLLNTSMKNTPAWILKEAQFLRFCHKVTGEKQ